MNTRITLMSVLMAGSVLGLSAQEHLKSLNPANIDKNTAASTDFYEHVNKGWIESHPLTPEYSRYGQFNILNDTSNNRVQRIVMNLSKTNPQKGTNAYKIATLYEQGMDSVRRNQLGATPIKADLARIENAKPEEMEDLFIWMHGNFSSPFFGAGPQEDLANSSQYAMYVSGAPISLGDRDYYLLNDKRNKEVREAYKKLIEAQMVNAGYSKKDAKRIMNNVMKIETLIADSTWTREESRNIPAMYNPRNIAQLKEMYPNLPWDRFFVETMGIPTPDQVIVTEINTVKQGHDIYSKLSDREKKDYYLWQYVSNFQSVS